MTEDDRKDLYWSLLKGIAQTAQDQLCAADEQHAWGRAERYELSRDVPPVYDLSVPVVQDFVITTATRQACLNCGKERFQ